MSITITRDYDVEWAKAIAKAKEVKPRVKVVGFGLFKVESSDRTTWYDVTFCHNLETREWECSCSCKRHTTGSRPKPCYHCPPCANIFKLQLIERAEASDPVSPVATASKATIKEVPCRGCNVPTEPEFIDSTGKCPDCCEAELFG